MEVARLFNELRENQIKYNPFNFYVKVPLKNLQKALFKVKLSDNDSIARKLGSYLLYYRTILIFIGMIGVFFLFKSRVTIPIGVFVSLFFAMLYIYLCAGTSPQCRNIEMRYFLQADVLMIIPAAFLIARFGIVERFIVRYLPNK
jgi:hypothetical protein